MIVAVTYEEGKVYGHFGHAKQFKVYDIALSGIRSAQVVDATVSGHDAMASFLAAHKVEVLICGGIGDSAKAALHHAGILIYGGVEGNADESVMALIQDSLDYNPNACCSGHGDQCGSCGSCGEGGCCH